METIAWAGLWALLTTIFHIIDIWRYEKRLQEKDELMEESRVLVKQVSTALDRSSDYINKLELENEELRRVFSDRN